MKTISIINSKGGVGKTTTALNLGGGLATMGKRVLLIDLDPQTNLSQGLGVKASERSIYEVLTGKCKLTPEEVEENLFLVPSSQRLVNLESEFINRIGGQVRLKKILSEVKGFDYIFIDCPPSLGLLTINSLTASDEVIIPLTPEYYSVQGIIQLRNTITEVQESLNPSLRIGGILITLFNKQKIIQRDIVGSIETTFGDLVYKTRIRNSVAIEEAPYQGKDIFHYSPESIGAEDYRNLCREFLEKCNNVIM